MITIIFERIDPEVCFIGCVEGIENGWMFLREIDPAARWDDSATPYRLKAIHPRRVRLGLRGSAAPRGWGAKRASRKR